MNPTELTLSQHRSLRVFSSPQMRFKLILSVYSHRFYEVEGAMPSPKPHPLIDSLQGYGHAMDTIGHTLRLIWTHIAPLAI